MMPKSNEPKRIQNENAPKLRRSQSEVVPKSYRSQDEVKSDTVTDTVSVTVSDTDTVNESVKDKKHIYGEYKHVRLTDKEHDLLVNDYGETNTHDAIKYLDEYIEMKGNKYKSHYLVMKKWVFDAVNKARGQPKEESVFDSWAKA